MPQFWNVLKGEMSLVGTRPPLPEEVEKYTNGHHKRLTMRPGMTGVWQTCGQGKSCDFEDIVRMDAWYVDNWSLWLDLSLIIKTVPVALLGRGSG
jgi:lipopolysaccharide/colanic/teichoic acid biosynthesis glycosyltransferase